MDKARLARWGALKEVRGEVEAMQRVQGHAGVVELREAVEDSRHVHLLMELCQGGKLFDDIRARGRYSERDSAFVARQLASALAHCHARGVLHRDVKPGNVLLEAAPGGGWRPPSVKLCNFGLTVRLAAQPGGEINGALGTPRYMAPETFTGGYGFPADVWSLGVTLYILLTGEPLFGDEPLDSAKDAAARRRPGFKEAAWAAVSEGTRSLVAQMLELDPARRPTAKSPLSHPWLRSALPFTSLTPQRRRRQQLLARRARERQGFCKPPAVAAAAAAGGEPGRDDMCHQQQEGPPPLPRAAEGGAGGRKRRLSDMGESGTPPPPTPPLKRVLRLKVKFNSGGDEAIVGPPPPPPAPREAPLGDHRQVSLGGGAAGPENHESFEVARGAADAAKAGTMKEESTASCGKPSEEVPCAGHEDGVGGKASATAGAAGAGGLRLAAKWCIPARSASDESLETVHLSRCDSSDLMYLRMTAGLATRDGDETDLDTSST